MTPAIEQAHAMIASFGGSESGRPGIATPSHAIELINELLVCGEWRLAHDLCLATESQRLSIAEGIELELCAIECLIRFGKLDDALSRLDVAAIRMDREAENLPSRLSQWFSILRGRALWRALRLQEAKEVLTAERARLLQEPDGKMLGWCSFMLSNAYWGEGNVTNARRFVTEALVSAYRNGDARLEAYANHSAGLMSRFLCHWIEARAHLREALDYARSKGHSELVIHAQRSIGIVDWKRGRLDAARTSALESARLATAMKAELSRCFAFELLALISLHGGDLVEARDFLQVALDLKPARFDTRS